MIDQAYVKTLVGKHVYAWTRDGRMIDGILDKIENEKIYLRANRKQVETKAFFPFFNPITPLVLFDLLAIGTSPFAFGGFPFFI